MCRQAHESSLAVHIYRGAIYSLECKRSLIGAVTHRHGGLKRQPMVVG